jgi:hypothetical protein
MIIIKEVDYTEHEIYTYKPKDFNKDKSEEIEDDYHGGYGEGEL